MKKLLSYEACRFLLVGAFTLVLDYAFLLALTELLGVYYIVSATLSFLIAVIVNYCLCQYWVFNDAKSMNGARFMLFVGSSVVALALNAGIIRISVEWLQLNYLYGKILSTIMVTLWNYVTKRAACRY